MANRLKPDEPEVAPFTTDKIGGALAWLLALGLPVLLSLFFAGDAQAACVRPAGATEKIINMDIGTVVIPNDLPVGGAIIPPKQFPIPINGAQETSWNCGSGGTLTGRILQGTAVPGMANVFTTAVTGVGIRLSRQISGSNSDNGLGQVFYPHTLIRSGQTAFYSPSYFTVELIKIGTKTGNGPLASGTYTTYSGDGDGKSAITSVLSGIGITIITPSCTVEVGSKNVIVNLGSVSRGSFKGVGSTAGDRPFNIKLNCQRGENAQNTILLNMRATADLSRSPGVTQVTQGTGVAAGVGIQILDRNSQPVVFGTAATVGPSADIQYVVPYTARYYQTAPNITTGPANGTATFTIEYQ